MVMLGSAPWPGSAIILINVPLTASQAQAQPGKKPHKNQGLNSSFDTRERAPLCACALRGVFQSPRMHLREALPEEENACVLCCLSAKVSPLLTYKIVLD